MMQLQPLVTLAGLVAAEQHILAQTPNAIDFEKSVHQVRKEYVKLRARHCVHVYTRSDRHNRLKEAEIIPTGPSSLAIDK